MPLTNEQIEAAIETLKGGYVNYTLDAAIEYMHNPALREQIESNRARLDAAIQALIRRDPQALHSLERVLRGEPLEPEGMLDALRPLEGDDDERPTPLPADR